MQPQVESPAVSATPPPAAPVPTPPQKQSSNIGKWVLNLLLLAGMAGAGWWAYRYLNHYETGTVTNDAQVEAFISPVNTRIGGYLRQINFNEHQAVKKGDTLAVIDDRELRIQVQQVEAAYLEAQAGRNVTTSSISTVRNNADVADANLVEMRVRLANAEQNYRRYERLLADESASRQQFEVIKTERDAMKAKYQAMLQQRKSADYATNEVSQRLNVNAAGIKRAAAALDLAKLNLSYTVIRAPYDGFMGRRQLQEGQLVQPGQPLATIVRGDQKWVTANFRETQTAGLQVGQPVTIKVDALNEQVFTGTVAAISQATGARYSAVPTDNSTGNFVKVQQRIPVRIEFSPATAAADLQRLRAGMNVEVDAQR
jgi:membrane fusion protein (multidrug efflux system)